MSAAHLAEAEAFLATMTAEQKANAAPCQACGRRGPVLLLDGKPGPGQWTRADLERAGDEGREFGRLEGPCCYGPGYSTP